MSSFTLLRTLPRALPRALPTSSVRLSAVRFASAKSTGEAAKEEIAKIPVKAPVDGLAFKAPEKDVSRPSRCLERTYERLESGLMG